MKLQTDTPMLHLRNLLVARGFDVEPANYPCGAVAATTYNVYTYKHLDKILVAQFWTTAGCSNILDSIYAPIHGAVVYLPSGEKIWFDDLNTANYSLDVSERVLNEYPNIYGVFYKKKLNVNKKLLILAISLLTIISLFVIFKL